MHAAVRALQAERPRHAITVPLIAQQAGVTPSTVYRRWGDLTELLADVAAERMRPDAPPTDTGTLHGDLCAYAEQYLEEMSAPTGRAYLRDVVASADPGRPAGRCDTYIRAQLEIIVARARGRGERTPPVGEIVEQVMAPMMYGILFAVTPIAHPDAARLVEALLTRTAVPAGAHPAR